METKLVLETVHNIHLQASKVEITMRRKNAPLVKAQIGKEYRWQTGTNEPVLKLYADHASLHEEKKKLTKEDVKINKYSLTRVCSTCGNKSSRKLKDSGRLFSTQYFIQVEEDKGLKYAYIFCSQECMEVFKINPLAYEKTKEEDAAVHV